jgi:NhaC family Na+:H+ antiporter
MVYTAGPSFIVALLVYLAAGILTDANSVAGSDFNHPILQEIEQAYSISWLVFIPALIVIIGTFNRKPAALVMVISSVTAMAIGIGVHGFSPYNAILSAITGFNVSMLEGMSNSSSDMLNILLNRGGINSMSTTLIIIIAAFLLAAGMDVSGGLDKLLQTMIERARSVFGLVAATLASGATMIALTSHGGVTALIVGGLFQDGYRERGLAPENLSRSLEDSVTILEPLLPWTVSAIFMATTLGVPTLAYMPWAVFCMTGWMFSLLMASIYERTGFGLKALQAE